MTPTKFVVTLPPAPKLASGVPFAFEAGDGELADGTVGALRVAGHHDLAVRLERHVVGRVQEVREVRISTPAGPEAGVESPVALIAEHAEGLGGGGGRCRIPR
jgi:hypothetical protein